MSNRRYEGERVYDCNIRCDTNGKMITNQVISGKLYKAMLVRNKKEEFEREEKLDYLNYDDRRHDTKNIYCNI